MLGPNFVLAQRLPEGGYRSADSNAIAHLARTVFDDDARLRRMPLVLSGIVAALDRGDLVKAQLLGLEIPIDRLDEPRLARLQHAADLLKYDSGEPRDQYGRWAREDDAVPKASLLRRLAPAVLRALAQLAARVAAAGLAEATAFLGIIFIPTNRSLISQGAVPNRPDLSYEYDAGAGRLRLYRQDGDNASWHSRVIPMSTASFATKTAAPSDGESMAVSSCWIPTLCRGRKAESRSFVRRLPTIGRAPKRRTSTISTTSALSSILMHRYRVDSLSSCTIRSLGKTSISTIVASQMGR